MHWSGTVFAWLVTISMCVAVFFSAKVVKVRNSWAAKLQKQKEEYPKVAENLRNKRFELDRAQGDWHRATEFWGRFEVSATNVQDPANGTLVVDLGSTQGITAGQWLYGFEIQPDGSAIYRGDFVAEDVREGQSLLHPNWRIRPGDTAGWQGGSWRWRLFLPASYPTHFTELEQALVLKDEQLNERLKTLQEQEALITSSQDQLKTREAELVGGPDLPQEPTLDQEYREGLVAALETVEEERNEQLVVIDQLRREVRELRDKIRATEAENRELVDKLPQPPTEVTQKP